MDPSEISRMSLSLYIPGNLACEHAQLISARDARSELVVDCLFTHRWGKERVDELGVLTESHIVKCMFGRGFILARLATTLFSRCSRSHEAKNIPTT